MTRVVNQLTIEGNSGDAVLRALDGRLNLLSPITCIGIAPDQSGMFITDWSNKRLRRVYRMHHIAKVVIIKEAAQRRKSEP